MKIGVFDSGFGGLEITGHLIKEMPDYDFIYLGDTARNPYGSRSQETIYKYVTESVDFLFKNDCQLVILACNTASSEALRKIQQDYLPEKYPDRRVLGVIIPAVEEAVSITNTNTNPKIGVMATESSVASGAFKREILKLQPKAIVFEQPCPLLVPFVESGEDDYEILRLILHKYLRGLVGVGIDSLILGCTHYGILKNEIQTVLSELVSSAKIISEGEIVALKLKNYLERHSEIEQRLSKNETREFYTTDLTEKFEKIGSVLIGAPIKVKKISL